MKEPSEPLPQHQGKIVHQYSCLEIATLTSSEEVPVPFNCQQDADNLICKGTLCSPISEALNGIKS